MKPSNRILPVIVLSQFCCTSLWFAGNGVMRDLVATFGLSESAVGHLTSAVQFGFIVGTLVFAILSIADRFSPSKVFFGCAVLGALFNLGVVWDGNGLASILSFRFFTGFFLAGIYPVGMKIAADYYEKGLGKSLGYLVGALVVGTAFPHLLKEMTHTLPWNTVLVSTSGLAVLGGSLMITLVPNGPYRKRSQQLQLSAFVQVFQNRSFRSAAFGYFGHMWELYTFWAFVPIMLQTYALVHPNTHFPVPLLSFVIIAIGGLACVLGGYLSQVAGNQTRGLDGPTALRAMLFDFPLTFHARFSYSLHRLFTVLGHGGDCRFPALLHLGGPKRFRRNQRHCSDHCKLYRLCHYHC